MDLDWSQLYALLHGEVQNLNDNPLFNSSSSMLDSPFSSSARPTAETRTAKVPTCTDDTESGHCWTMSSKGAHPGAHASDQALSGSLCVKSRQGSTLQGVDFEAAKQRIAGKAV
ncbi:hypothetical protein DUNSADRAFT_13025 [Dunaliella salina]|uniref:Encoded protein n=1 Tax=Dunaliella salina TaxID=3046 RepID=A0ABQ7FRB7_DUNSA|nr:hypothetical protein DUNSADRAFT_13025 [Dunaliella salina]|eukprot:KAF5825246.1 hypothetical protein DUNSADRAFT_13025 [Dunaliella salina]